MYKSVFKRNQLPKLSLVALAIAAANSATAVECNTKTIKIDGQQNTILTNCDMEHSKITYDANSMINVVNSQNVTLENNHLSFLSNGTNQHHSDSLFGINVENSTVTIRNTNVTINNDIHDIHDIQGALKINNSTTAIEGGTFKVNNSNEDIFMDLFTLRNSKLSLKNTTLLSGDNDTTIELYNSTASLDNVTANSGTIFSSNIPGGSESLNTILVNNSTLSSSSHFFGTTFNRIGTNNVKLTLNNSTAKAKVFLVLSEFDEGYSIKEHINIIANNSILDGTPKVVNNSSNPNNDLSTLNATLNNSEWSFSMFKGEEDNGLKFEVEPSISNLALTNSNINLIKSEDFYTFTIGNLSGNGNFALNTDLANQKSDQILITGKADGTYTLAVNDTGNEPQSANGKVTLVKIEGNGDAIFRLKDKDYVDAGAYRYRLNKESNDWVLSNREAELTKKEEPAKPVQPSTNLNERVMLSEKSNALVSLRQAQLLQLEQGLVGIHQRLGELKQGANGNVWIRNINSNNKFSATDTTSNSRTAGFEQRYHGVQLGADKAVTDDFRLGGFVGTERSTVDFNGEYGSGKLTGKSVGLYATYHNASGLYLDNIAKFSRLKSTSNTTGSRHYNAYTLSSEIGKIYQLANQWSITPNAQIAWSTVSGKNDEERLSSLYSRVGARVSKVIALSDWAFQPYAEINGISTHNNHSKVNVNQYHFDVASGKGRIATALGLNAVTGKHRFGLEVQNSNGKRVDQPFAIQATYRYQW